MKKCARIIILQGILAIILLLFSGCGSTPSVDPAASVFFNSGNELMKGKR